MTGSPNRPATDSGDVADLHDVLFAPDVESLVVHDVTAGLEHGESPGDVLGVHQRAPRAPVALEPHLVPRERRAGEVC